MLITYRELCDFVEKGVITDTPMERVNAASIDVTLGDILWAEDSQGWCIDLAKKEAPRMYKYKIRKYGYNLDPGEFILGQTEQKFYLPDDVAIEFRLKSSGARAGLDNALATWGDPGWNDSVLTLELRNNLSHHQLKLTSGMPIGQIVFWRGNRVPEHASYASKGRYNNDSEAQPSRGLR